MRDYDPEANRDNVLARALDHKEVIISHLSWVSLFLGFHTFGLYVHKRLRGGPGAAPPSKFLVEPVFAQWIQAFHGKTLLRHQQPAVEPRQHCLNRLAQLRQRLAAGLAGGD